MGELIGNIVGGMFGGGLIGGAMGIPTGIIFWWHTNYGKDESICYCMSILSLIGVVVGGAVGWTM